MLEEQDEVLSAQEQSIKMYRDFDGLVFALSRVDGITGIGELKKMNTYEFYEHKKNLEVEMKRKRGKGKSED